MMFDSIFMPFYMILKLDLLRFLVVPEVPELYRKLRETYGRNSLYLSSRSELMVPSYDKNTKRFM